jgi:hypothetical protein
MGGNWALGDMTLKARSRVQLRLGEPGDVCGHVCLVSNDERYRRSFLCDEAPLNHIEV